MDQDTRFAVLIDADNISEKYIRIILEETASLGIATYKRIYGDFTSPHLNNWKTVLLDNSIIPMQQYGYTTGKSSTDSAMIIDAMDILYSGNVGGFCIVSSDSDFTRLAARLREAGMIVIGMGEAKTPKAFIAACNQFKYLDILYANNLKELASESRKNREKARKLRETLANDQQASAKTVEASSKSEPSSRSRRRQPKEEVKEDPIREEAHEEPAPAPPVDLDTITDAILAIVEEFSDDDGWIIISDVGNQLAKRYPDFDVRNYGHKKLSSFLQSLSSLEVRRERGSGSRNSQLIFVRIRQN